MTATPQRKRLNLKGPLGVTYCIPAWLRDLQIQSNCARPGIGRISEAQELRDEPIAIVCYGPSLNETWEKVREFKHVISCSGSHKFLIDRGIIPSWHTEVDPREHKIKLMGQPHPDVEYLIASACHPKLLDHLAGYNVKLWHVFAQGEEAPVLPRGEWKITGGCGVGLRAMTIARFLGFREQHIFGMDGSEGPSGKHAGAHPNQPRDAQEVEYPEGSGNIFLTTPALLEAARGTFHELDVMWDMQATFYGEGLVQAMSKDYVRAPCLPNIMNLIAYNEPETISKEFRELNEKMHKEVLHFGIGSSRYASIVQNLVKSLKLESVLDYGCGKNALAKALPFPIWSYDPAIPEFAAPPRPADLVVCFDVLEHIEPDKLDYVLDDIRRCMKKVGYFSIHTGPAQKTYADGRNTHLIQENTKWWHARLKEFFKVGKFQQHNHEWHVLVEPLGKQSVKTNIIIPEEFDKRSHKRVLETWVKENGWTRGAEIGVFQGVCFVHLLKHCPNLFLYGVDIWEEQPEQDALYEVGGRSYKFFGLPKWYERTLRRIQDEFPGRGELLKGDSVQMAKHVRDASLDFVFIDGDHTYEGVKRDILAWQPKVRYGGVICGHDIFLPSVRKAVDECVPNWTEHKQAIWGKVLK